MFLNHFCHFIFHTVPLQTCSIHDIYRDIYRDTIGVIMKRKGPLTVTFVKNAKTPGRYYDNQNTGLHLWVRKGGTKSYIQRTTINGKQVDISLGSVATTDLKDARLAAQENSILISQGIDPRKHKKQPTEIPTFREVTSEALVKQKQELTNTKHFNQWTSTLTQYAFPILGDTPVDTITVNDVHKALEKIWLKKNETAQRTRGRIEYVLNYAITKGYASHPNPAVWKGNLEHLLPKPDKVWKSKKMPALQLKDAHRWWRELKMRDGNGAKALTLLTLVAARSGEVRGMTFEEIEFFSEEESEKSGFFGIWKIPEKRMKARIAHEIPIIAPVKELINAQPNHNGLVFSAPRGGMLSDMTISATMKRMHHSDDEGYFDKEYGQPAVPHGIRSTFRNWAAETQQNRDIAELQLAHRIGNETEQAYNRTTLLRLRAKMLEQWHDFLEGAPLH